MSDNFLIYGWINATGDPFYVGYTKCLKRRTASHRYRMNLGINLPCYNKLRKLLREGHEWIIRVIEDSLSEENVQDRERFWIAYYRAQGIKLYNLTDGGDGATGFTPEQQKKMSEQRMGHPVSEETRQKISEAHKGMRFTKEHKKNLSIARRERKITDETRRKMSATSKGKINIKVFKVISPDGHEYITEHGLTVFCEQHDLTTSLLSKVACGERPHHKGWKCERMG